MKITLHGRCPGCKKQLTPPGQGGENRVRARDGQVWHVRCRYIYNAKLHRIAERITEGV